MRAFTDPATLEPGAIESGTTFAPRFDAHGLITAVAIDASSGEILMLAHMNAQALRLTIETGDAHYYSRSRKSIWRKGETSGEVQRVRQMRVDCDQDAILLVVEPQGHGAACHTGRRSCFYRTVRLEADAVRLEYRETPRLFDPADVYG